MTICFATNNTKKIEEVKAALAGKVTILSLQDIGCTEELPETGDTLDDNAFEKARYVHQHFGVDCFADDTGLEVDALGGSPGVYSGRFAGEPRSDARNMDLLLEKMQDQTNRSARFRTVIALILNGKEHQFDGLAEGEITTSPSGMQGFGYDPGHSIVKAPQAGLHPKALLYKPFKLTQLLSVVETVIDAYSS